MLCVQTDLAVREEKQAGLACVVVLDCLLLIPEIDEIQKTMPLRLINFLACESKGQYMSSWGTEVGLSKLLIR